MSYKYAANINDIRKRLKECFMSQYPLKFNTGPKMNQPCPLCGYDDQGTGDTSHVCGNMPYTLDPAFRQIPGYKESVQIPVDSIKLKEVFENFGNKVDPLKASRFNAGKSKWSLVSFEGLEYMVEVLEFGASKYSAGNWANGGGLSYSETIESLLRHTFALARGEDIDPESGKHHIGHIQCNAMFLGHFFKNPEEFSRDDRVLLGSRNDSKTPPKGANGYKNEKS